MIQSSHKHGIENAGIIFYATKTGLACYIHVVVDDVYGLN